MDAIVQAGVVQRLNHVECVYRPGERDLAYKLFDLLGFKTFEYMNGEVFVAAVDPPSWEESGNDNYLAGREVRPEQWVFDQALAKALRQPPFSKDAFATHQQMLATTPAWGMHFGIRLNSIEKWEAAIARIREVEKHAPALRSRVKLLAVYRTEDPPPGNGLNQAFFWTDVIASGSLALGQQVELTTYIG